MSGEGVSFHLVVANGASKHQPIAMELKLDGTSVVRGSFPRWVELHVRLRPMTWETKNAP